MPMPTHLPAQPTRRMARAVRAALIAGIAGLSLAAAAQSAGPPIRIGVIGPFSGPSSDFGTPMLNGVRLAVEEINRVGGYLGRPIETLVKDDRADPDTGLQGAQALVQAGVVATIGFCNTGVALKALPVFQQARSPLLVPCATGTPLTAQVPAVESYVFRTSARDAIQAPFVVNDIVQRGWKRVAVFADTSGYGEAGLVDVQKALAAHGLAPAHVARFAIGVKDLKAELQAARAAGANVIFSYTVGPENATIANDRRTLGWDVPLVGGWPLSFPFFIDGAAQAAVGALMAQTFIAEPSNERRAAFLANYARAFKTRLTVPMAAAQAYDTTYLLLYAMFGVPGGRFTGPALKASLENLQRTYYGVVATYDHPFTADDKDAVTDNMLVMGKVHQGAVTFAYPEDARRNLFVQRKR